MMRGPCLFTWVALASACGLERDWAAFQQAFESEGQESGSSTLASSTTASTTAESTAESTDGGADGTSGTGGGASASSGHGAGTSSTSDSGAAGSTGPAAVCGDGVVEGDEECDDPGDTACFNCIRDRLVFITSMTNIQGNFLSETGIKYYCNHLAAVAGLLNGNEARFMPWISTSDMSAADRLYHSPGRYVLRNGLVFAMSWDALMAGEILNPLNVDENSQTQNNGAWTDTRPDGTPMPGTHCNDWTSDSDELLAYYGRPDAVDGSWTLYVGDATNPIGCSDGRALYCFESP